MISYYYYTFITNNQYILCMLQNSYIPTTQIILNLNRHKNDEGKKLTPDISLRKYTSL